MGRLLFFILLLCAASSYAQTSYKVQLKCQWNDTTNIRRNTQYNSRYNDVWGFTWAGKEYGVIGSSEGIHVIDVATCQQKAFYRGKASGPSITHRDFKTYQHYLYAVSDEDVGALQIFDFSTLPDSLHLVWESDPNQLSRSHTIFIDTDFARLYCASPKSQSSSSNLQIYSLANPVQPVLTHTLNAVPDSIMDRAHAVYARHDTAYLSLSDWGYLVITFDAQNNVKRIGGLNAYQQKGYNHSSWINNQGLGVMADDTHGFPMKVIDTKPRVEVKQWFSPCNGDTCVPHNPYLIGNVAFISHYFQGLQIYAIKPGEAPRQLGYYDTYPGKAIPNGFAGAWGCYPFLPSGKVLVSDMQTGLYVLDASEAVASLGVQDVSATSFSVYPNPASTALTLTLPSGSSSGGTITLFDATGSVVLRKAITPIAGNQLTLPLPPSWPAGLYWIRLQLDDYSATTRFLKIPD